MKIKTISIIVIVAFSSFLFSGCFKSKDQGYKVNLEIWGAFDDSGTFSEAINEYRKINPYVGEIKYRKLTVDSYKKEVIDTMASGQGPDIFLIHNTWLPSFKDKTEPSPDWITTEQEFRNNFVDVAADDFLDGGKIYAVPLSVDSLALYYNKDLFNAAGIVNPPATWEEFNADSKALTKIGPNGQIIQAGAALGTAYNINRSTDVLGLLMFQNGVQMTNRDKLEATFDKAVSGAENSQYTRSGENALNYYTQFASSGAMYCWNPTMHYSIDAFYENTVAMMINYSWHYQTIKAKNSKLNFAVAPVPQLSKDNPINYANYWGFAVSKNKSASLQDDRKEKSAYDEETMRKVRIHESWQFLKFLTMKNGGKITLRNGITGNTKDFPISIDPAKKYSEETGKPAGRRDIIAGQKDSPVLGPFAYGNLIAKSWYQKDPEATEVILADMIDSVNRGRLSSYEALKLAANRVTNLMR